MLSPTDRPGLLKTSEVFTTMASVSCRLRARPESTSGRTREVSGGSPITVKRPSERPSGSNKRRKHGDHESNPEVCSRRLVYTHISSFQTLQLTSGSSESMMSINLTITKCLHLKYMIHLITEAQRLHFNKSHQKIFLQAQVHLTMTWTSV